MSRVTCHVSHVMCHVSHIYIYIFIFFSFVELVGGGSIITVKLYSTVKLYRREPETSGVERQVWGMTPVSLAKWTVLAGAVGSGCWAIQCSEVQ